MNAGAICSNDTLKWSAGYAVKYTTTGFSGSGTMVFLGGYLLPDVTDYSMAYYAGIHNGSVIKNSINTAYTYDANCILNATIIRPYPARNLSIYAKPKTTSTQLYGTISDGIKSSPVTLVRK